MFYNFLFLVVNILILGIIFYLLKNVWFIIKKNINEIKLGVHRLKEKWIRNKKRKCKKKSINLLESFINYFNDLTSSPRMLFESLCISSWLFSLLLASGKVTLVNESFKIKITPFLAIYLLAGFIVLLTKMIKSTMGIDKIFPVFIFGYLILSISILPIEQGNKISGKSETALIVMIILFVVLVSSFYYVVVKYIDKRVGVVLVISIYMLTIIIGSISFGEYYLNHFQTTFSSEISMLEKNSNVWLQVSIVIKVGIRYFFEFPENQMLNKVSLLQFGRGKLNELVFLGYIVSHIIQIKDDGYTKNSKRWDRYSSYKHDKIF